MQTRKPRLLAVEIRRSEHAEHHCNRTLIETHKNGTVQQGITKFNVQFLCLVCVLLSSIHRPHATYMLQEGLRYMSHGTPTARNAAILRTRQEGLPVLVLGRPPGALQSLDATHAPQKGKIHAHTHTHTPAHTHTHTHRYLST